MAQRSKPIRIALDPNDPTVAAFLAHAATVYPGAAISHVVLEALGVFMGLEPEAAAGLALKRAVWKLQSARARRALGLALQQARAAYEQAAYLEGE